MCPSSRVSTVILLRFENGIYTVPLPPVSSRWFIPHTSSDIIIEVVFTVFSAAPKDVSVV